MTPEQIQEILEYLRSIGEMAVSKGFELALRQVYVDAAIAGIFLVVSTIIVIIGVWIVRKGTKVDSYDSEQYYCIGILTTVIGSIVMIENLISLASRLINPEWQAIKNIFHLLPGG